MNILAIGDVVGKPGRSAVTRLLSDLRREYGIDLAIANGENAAGGLGLTPSTAHELLDFGIDVITSGNHIWQHKDIVPYLDGGLPVIRPLNYPPASPGRGYVFQNNVVVVNLIGRTFMGNFDCPFRAMDKLLSEIGGGSRPIVVDFHAEATSEKVAMGRYLDGQVSAVLGTHTHVGTIDAQILPGGTGFVTDIGMVGPVNSIIGDDIDSVIGRFLTQIPGRLSVGKGRVEFNAIVVQIDNFSGKAVGIERIRRVVDAARA